MLVIDGVKVAKGAAFMVQNKGNTKFVVATLHRDNTVTYLPEKDLERYAQNRLRDYSVVERVSNDEFATNVFRKWTESRADITNRKRAEQEEARARFEAMQDDFVTAIKMDILVDASRGVDMTALMVRMDALLKEEKEAGYTDGYDAGYDDTNQYARERARREY